MLKWSKGTIQMSPKLGFFKCFRTLGESTPASVRQKPFCSFFKNFFTLAASKVVQLLNDSFYVYGFFISGSSLDVSIFSIRSRL